MLSIFSCACWPSVCLLWRNVYLGLLPIFLIELFGFLILSCMNCLYILEIKPLLVGPKGTCHQQLTVFLLLLWDGGSGEVIEPRPESLKIQEILPRDTWNGSSRTTGGKELAMPRSGDFPSLPWVGMSTPSWRTNSARIEPWAVRRRRITALLASLLRSHTGVGLRCCPGTRWQCLW